jgi:ubiquinone/menaquinone biosynthesis C-methylase UbiE
MAIQAEGQRHERRFHRAPGMLRSPGRVERLEVERVVALCLEGIAAQNMLDVGTGTGIFAEGFAAQGLEVAGIDANPAMLVAARRYLPRVWFALAPAEAIPYPNGAFDVVFLGHILHEADDPLTAIQEARRVAGQRATVLEWPFQQEEYGPPLAHRLKPERVAALARSAGFQNVEILPLAHSTLFRLSG